MLTCLSANTFDITDQAVRDIWVSRSRRSRTISHPPARHIGEVCRSSNRQLGVVRRFDLVSLVVVQALSEQHFQNLVSCGGAVELLSSEFTKGSDSPHWNCCLHSTFVNGFRLAESVTCIWILNKLNKS